MHGWLPAIYLLLLAPLALCWGLWFLFALLALLPARRPAAGEGVCTIDVLIPAHDEEGTLPRLLASLAAQSASGKVSLGRTLVIADHCSDQTAAIARANGAEVLERGTGPRGKPAALRDGLAMLAPSGAARAVVIIDADCVVSPNLIEALAAALGRGHRVAQVADILDPGTGVQKLHGPSMIAFSLKNMVRPRGMARLGLPTQVFGTGMCFRGDVLDRISFSDHLTEDLKISHDLLLAGIAPAFVPEASVCSDQPEDRGAMSTQKLRWETGQVHTWLKLPGMLVRLLARGRLASAVSLIDWSAPPAAMAVGGWLVLAAAGGVLIMLGLLPWWVLIPLFVTLCFLAGYVILGTAQIGGPLAVVSLFVAVPRFLLWKSACTPECLPAAKTWDRTPRNVARQGEP